MLFSVKASMANFFLGPDETAGGLLSKVSLFGDSFGSFFRSFLSTSLSVFSGLGDYDETDSPCF